MHYNYFIVILHVHFARVAKGVGEYLDKINYSLKENIMKKLIALFAASTVASTAAVAGVALSGAASVSYDDNGSTGGAASDGASSTTYDADLTIVGTSGDSTLTVVSDIDAAWSITSVDLATEIGPVTIAADMFNTNETNLDDGDGDYKSSEEPDDRSISVTLDAPVGDMTVGLDDDGEVTLSGTWAGVTITHAVDADTTTGAVSVAGMDVSVTNKAAATTWSVATTVSGVDLTLDSENDVTAVFGLAGNTLTLTHNASRASVTSNATVYSTDAVVAYTTAALSRDLTSGATLTATYSTKDDSLTLKAAVTF